MVDESTLASYKNTNLKVEFKKNISLFILEKEKSQMLIVGY